MRTAFERKEEIGNIKTRPRTKAEAEWGGEHMLAKALKKREAWENEDGSISWCEHDKVTTRGHNWAWKVGGNRKLKDGEKEKLDELLVELGMASKTEVSKLRKADTTKPPPEACVLQLSKAHGHIFTNNCT